MIFLVSCTVNIERTKEEETKKPIAEETIKSTDNVTQTEVFNWPTEKINYWTAMYFAQLSMNPSVRMRYEPYHTYELAKCIVKGSQKLYPDFKWWEENIGTSQDNLNPIYGKEIYKITYNCSIVQQQIQQKELLEKMEAGPDLKDSI